MAEKIRGRPYEGDAREEIRRAGFWGFWKLSREIVGPDGELVYPERCNRLDYEGDRANFSTMLTRSILFPARSGLHAT
jgi:hypothetical protein